MDANYWNDEKVWVFWGCCALVALFAYVSLRYICKRCKKVTVTPEECDPMNEDEPTESPFVEHDTFIFKDSADMFIQNDHNCTMQFTYDEAKEIAKTYPSYKIQRYGAIHWYSSATYFDWHEK